MGELRRVYVHVGPPKSGTTFIQNVLFANKSALADAGYALPCSDWPAHRRAVARLVRRDADAPDRSPADAPPRDAWDRLVGEVQGSGAHTALLSAEQLSGVGASAIRALVRSFAPAEAHVVYTARDLAAAVPAGWQTRLRNRTAPTWREFCDAVREPGGPSSLGGAFWQHQDPAAVLPRWLRHVPPERVHVVTVPPAGSDPGVLWRRFCAATGLRADAYSLDVPAATPRLAAWRPRCCAGSPPRSSVGCHRPSTPTW